MDVTHCPELSPFSFLHVCIDTNSSLIWAIPLHGEATQHVITHLLACFAAMGTPTSIKTDNGPAYISRQFKHFLQSSSIRATPLRGEATQHIITHLLAYFAVMGTPSSIKKQTMVLPIFLDTLNNFYNLFLLTILQVFLIIHRHKT